MLSDNVGIMMLRLYADGRLADSQDFRQPRWPDHVRCDFTRRQPCSAVLTGGMYLDTRTVPDGARTIRVETVDAAGNSAHVDRTVLVDNTPPPPASAAVEGGEGWRQANGFAIRWAPSSEEGSPVARVHYSLCRVGAADQCSQGARAARDDRSLDDSACPHPASTGFASGSRTPRGTLSRPTPARRSGCASTSGPACRLPGTGRPRAADARAGGLGRGVGTAERSGRDAADWKAPVAGAGDSRERRPSDRPHRRHRSPRRCIRAASRRARPCRQRAQCRPANGRLPDGADTAASGSEPHHGALGFPVSAWPAWSQLQKACSSTLHPSSTATAGPCSEASRWAGGRWRELRSASMSSSRIGGSARRAGTLETDSSGRFRHQVGTGASRTVRYRYEGTPRVKPAAAQVTVLVRARTAIAVSRRLLRNGDSRSLQRSPARRAGPGRGQADRPPGALPPPVAHVRHTAPTPAAAGSRDYRFEATRGLVRYHFQGAHSPRGRLLRTSSVTHAC